MKDIRGRDLAAFFLFGSAVGAAIAILVAPDSGARTRRVLRRRGQGAAEYIVEAGKEVADRCDDLCKRSGELMSDAAHDLSEKYRELYEKSKELVDEAAELVRRAGDAAKSQLS